MQSAPTSVLGAARGYTGPDRRRPAPSAGFRAQAVRYAGGVLIVVALWIGTVSLAAHSPATTSLAISLSHGVTGALLLASAALALAVWRITGTTRAACAVVGLAVAGLSAPIMGILSRAANSGNVRLDLVEMLAAATELALIACVAAAFFLPPVTSRLRPLRLASPAVAACILAVAGILAIDGTGATVPWLTAVALALRIAIVAAWIAAAAAFTIRGLGGRLTRSRHITAGDLAVGAALLLPAAGATAQLVMGPVAFQTTLVPTGFALAVACLIAGMATVALWRLHTWHGTQLIEVSGELRDTRTDLAGLESDQARRLHDARNAIFAIAGATELLVRPARHSELDPAHLQRLITAELDRLGHLLDPAFHGSDRDFTTTEMLEPLIAAYRARGIDIDANVTSACIRGRRELLVGVITNLLTNARVHAPGAHIWVTAHATAHDDFPAGAVRIVVADDGPGIPANQREAVLLPGVRGSRAAAPGSGLGLASAVQALSEMRGTLHLSERDGGGTVVTVTVPTAPDPTQSVTAPPRSQRSKVHQ